MNQTTGRPASDPSPQDPDATRRQREHADVLLLLNAGDRQPMLRDYAAGLAVLGTVCLLTWLVAQAGVGRALLVSPLHPVGAIVVYLLARFMCLLRVHGLKVEPDERARAETREAVHRSEPVFWLLAGVAAVAMSFTGTGGTLLDEAGIRADLPLTVFYAAGALRLATVGAARLLDLHANAHALAAARD